MGKRKRKDERKQQGNGGDYEYLLVGERRKDKMVMVSPTLFFIFL